MQDATQRSDARRTLLERHLHGDLRQTEVRAPRAESPQRMDKASGARERVVAIQKGTSRLPFFYLHGQWDGGGLYCFPLARDLGADQPFYAVDPYTFHDLRVLPTLEEVAAAHIKSLRAVQHEGPYLLGGYCNGALVAVEIARQLEAQGQKVGLLAMIDPMAPSDPKLLRTVTHHIGDVLRWSREYVYAGAMAKVVVNHIGKLLGIAEDKQVDHLLSALYLHRRAKDAYHYLRYSQSRQAKRAQLVDRPRQADLGDRPGTVRDGHSRFRALVPPVKVLRQDYEGLFIWLASNYVWRHCPGRLTFLWSGSEPINSYRRRAWRELVQGPDEIEYVIPGSHATLRDEDLPLLAQRLRLCLDEAQTTV